MRIRDSHQNETPKLSLDDVLVGAFKIAKAVVFVSLNCGNVFTLISDNMSTFGRNKNLATLIFWKNLIPLYYSTVRFYTERNTCRRLEGSFCKIVDRSSLTAVSTWWGREKGFRSAPWVRCQPAHCVQRKLSPFINTEIIYNYRKISGRTIL